MRPLSLLIFVGGLALIVFYSTRVLAQLEPISEQLVAELRADFQNGRVPDDQFLSANSVWNCELFGMRSRLQVRQQNHYYRFEPGSTGWRNRGHHVIRSYRSERSGLSGSNGKLLENVRLTKEGQLLSELTVAAGAVSRKGPQLAATTGPDRIVVAYTKCSPAGGA